MRFWTMVLSLVIASAIATTAFAQEKKKDGKRGPRQSAEERFKAMDKDSNGELSKAEFVAGFSRMGEDRAKELFTKMGGKDDKGINLEQFKKGMEEFRKSFGDRKKGEKKQ